MKNDRQKMILDIIAQEVVETQEQLLSLLDVYKRQVQFIGLQLRHKAQAT